MKKTIIALLVLSFIASSGAYGQTGSKKKAAQNLPGPAHTPPAAVRIKAALTKMRAPVTITGKENKDG